VSQRHNKALAYLYRVFKTNPRKRAIAKKRRFKASRRVFKRRYTGRRRFSKPRRRRFAYDLSVKEEEFRKKKRRFRSKNYFLLYKLRTFYGNLRQRTLMRRGAGGKRNQNIWAGITPLLLEGRLDILLYRTGLVKSIFFARQFIRHQGVLINGRLTCTPNRQIQVGDVVSLSRTHYQPLFRFLLNRLKDRRVLMSLPPYLYMNYRIGAFTLVRPPQGGEIAFPFLANARIHRFSK